MRFIHDDVRAEAVVGVLRASEFKAVEVQVPYICPGITVYVRYSVYIL